MCKFVSPVELIWKSLLPCFKYPLQQRAKRGGYNLQATCAFKYGAFTDKLMAQYL